MQRKEKPPVQWGVSARKGCYKGQVPPKDNPKIKTKLEAGDRWNEISREREF